MDSEQGNQYIVAELGREKYAFSIAVIKEILKLQPITMVPNCEAYIKGVTNIRGKIVPVVSLRCRFGMEEQMPTKDARIVVVQYRDDQDEWVGMMVDRVCQVTKIRDIQPAGEVVSGQATKYIEGIGHSEDGDLISILNIDQLTKRTE